MNESRNNKSKHMDFSPLYFVFLKGFNYLKVHCPLEGKGTKKKPFWVKMYFGIKKYKQTKQNRKRKIAKERGSAFPLVPLLLMQVLLWECTSSKTPLSMDLTYKL